MKNYEKICDFGSSYEFLDITPNLQGEEKMINWKPKDLLCERHCYQNERAHQQLEENNRTLQRIDES